MKKRFLFAAGLFVLAPSVFALSSGSVVFDPTNFSKNMITAAQSIQAVQKQIEGNLTKYYQLQEMYRQGKAIASGDLNAAASVVGGPQLAKQIQDARSMYDALGNLNGGVSDLQARYNFAKQMAQKYGMSIVDYQKLQKERAENNNREAQAQQDANVRAAKYVQETYGSVQRLQEQNPMTDTSLLQTMNKQMAILNTTNAQLLDFAVRKDQAEKAKIPEQKADEERRKEMADARVAESIAADEKLKASIAADKKLLDSKFQK